MINIMKVTNKNNGIVPGDIGLVKGGSFLSKGILYFMNKYRKLKGLPKMEMYTHSFSVIKIWDRLFVAEMLKEGIVVSSFVKAYGNKIDKIKFLTPKKPYSNKEKSDYSEAIITNSFESVKYDFFGLLHQIVFSLTGKWIGKKGNKAKKRMYCTEAVAVWANEVRKDTFKNPYSTNPLDILNNPNYKTKDLWK